MSLEDITTSGPTIVVHNMAELMAAYKTLSTTAGGGTIEAVGDGTSWGRLQLYNYGSTLSEQPVIIKSADPEEPVQFDTLYIREVDNLRLDGILMDNTGTAAATDGIKDINVLACNNVQIVNSTFLADQDNVLKDGAVDGLGTSPGGAGEIRWTSDFLFENNVINGYGDGLCLREIDGAEFVGNDISNIYQDGLQIAGVQNVLVDGNNFHDWYGVADWHWHEDLIQVWGAGADTLTSHLTISNNIFYPGDGRTAGQSIFIRNEEFGKEGDATAGYYTDINILNNVIVNSHWHGISIADTDGAVISGNTVLWNQDAYFHQIGSTAETSAPPEIRVNMNDKNIVVTDNVAGNIYANAGTDLSSNLIVNFTDPNAANYVGKLFVDAVNGGSIEDYLLKATSEYYGKVGVDFDQLLAHLDLGGLVIETPVAEEPVVEEPVVEVPVVEEPVVIEPVIEDSVAVIEPVVDTVIPPAPVEETVVEDPVEEVVRGNKGRGDDKEKSFVGKFFEFFTKIFGGGKKDSADEETTTEALSLHSVDDTHTESSLADDSLMGDADPLDDILPHYDPNDEVPDPELLAA